MSRVLPDLFYDIKYAVGGVERGVDACFVGKTLMVRGSHEPNVLCCAVCAVPAVARFAALVPARRRKSSDVVVEVLWTRPFQLVAVAFGATPKEPRQPRRVLVVSVCLAIWMFDQGLFILRHAEEHLLGDRFRYQGV